MLNIGVCDDDLIFASKIETLLLNMGKKMLIEMNIEVYSDGCELWKDFQEGVLFDILYLDIEMIRINGIDVAKKIRKSDLDVIIIYISNYENYFIELFEVEPFRFIKKPVDEHIFRKYFEKAYERILKHDVHFEYKFNKISHKMLLKDILYFESSGRLIMIQGKHENGKFYGKLNLVERKVKNENIPFLRIHQSYLVNYRYIKEISFYKVVLFNGVELQISEDRQKIVREKYNDLMGGEFLD